MPRWQEYDLPALIAGAAGTLLIARKLGLSQRQWIGWTAGGLALGPPGLLVMLSLFDPPHLERCSSCGRFRVVAGETCERCGASAPRPPPDGTEVIVLAAEIGSGP